MKLLLFSDFHLHNWTYGASYNNGWNSRLLAQLDVGSQIYRIAEEHLVDGVVFLGDLFHTPGKIDAHVLTVANQIMKDLAHSFPLYILTGNHDMATKDGSVHSLSWLPGTVIDSPTIIGDMAFCPYTTDKNIVQKILNETPKGGTCFLHQGVSGHPLAIGSDFVIPNEILHTSMIPEDIQVFTGHYHNPTNLGNLAIVGATMQHNWGDTGGFRGIVIYENNSPQKYTWVSLNYPNFYKVEPLMDIPMGKHFYKLIDCKKDHNEVREELLEAGALSVEFEIKKIESSQEVAVEDFNIEKIISDYENVNKVSDSRIETGRNLREGKYEAPELEG